MRNEDSVCLEQYLIGDVSDTARHHLEDPCQNVLSGLMLSPQYANSAGLQQICAKCCFAEACQSRACC